jgi:hypothetical protein
MHPVWKMHVPRIRCNDLQSSHQHQFFLKSNVVGTVTKKQAWQSRVRNPAGTWDFYHLQNVQISSVVHPHSLSMVIGGFFLSHEARNLGCKADHAHPFSAAVMKECSYASTPPVSSWQTQGTHFTFLHTWWWKHIHFLKCCVFKSQNDRKCPK